MQARRKNSKIVSFLCPVSLLAEVDAAVASQQANTLSAPLSGRSEWIIRAIKRDLNHRERSKRYGATSVEAPPQRPAYGLSGPAILRLEESLQGSPPTEPSQSDAGKPGSESPTQSPGAAGSLHNPAMRARLRDLQYLQEQ